MSENYKSLFFDEYERNSVFQIDQMKSYDELLCALDSKIQECQSESAVFDKPALTIDLVNEYKYLQHCFDEMLNEQCPSFSSNYFNVLRLKTLKALIDDNIDQFNSIMKDFEMQRKIEEFHTSNLPQHVRMRLLDVPPLYKHYTKWTYNLVSEGSGAARLDFFDGLMLKNTLQTSESITTSLSAMSETNYSTNILIWNDNFIKEILSNRPVDVVLDINIFVQLVVASIGELTSDCLIPMLKLVIDSNQRGVLIFDENISKEKKMNYDDFLLNTCCGERSSKPLRTRIVNENVFKTASTTNAISDFVRITHDDKYDEWPNFESAIRNYIIRDKLILSFKSEMEYADYGSECPNELVIDVEKSNTHIVSNTISRVSSCDSILTEFRTDVDEKQNHGNGDDDECSLPANNSYSYGIWRLDGLNLLIRFHSFSTIVEQPVEEERLVFLNFQQNSEATAPSSLQTLIRNYVAMKLNLCSTAVNVNFVPSPDEVHSVTFSNSTLESPETDVLSKIESVFPVVRHLFENMINNMTVPPDYYLLRLTPEMAYLDVSVNDQIESDFDLRINLMS